MQRRSLSGPETGPGHCHCGGQGLAYNQGESLVAAHTRTDALIAIGSTLRSRRVRVIGQPAVESLRTACRDGPASGSSADDGDEH